MSNALVKYLDVGQKDGEECPVDKERQEVLAKESDGQPDEAKEWEDF